MAYCSECGVELATDAKFCHSCGTDVTGLETSRDSRPVERDDSVETLTVQTGTGDRHYNARSIAYLRDSATSLSAFGWLLVLAIVGLGVVGVYLGSRPGQGTGIFYVLPIASLVLVWLFLPSDHGFEVGTLTGADSYKGTLSDEFVDAVRDAAADEILVSGQQTSWTKARAYRYHFYPHNVVQINHSTDTNDQWVVPVIVASALAAVGTYTWAPTLSAFIGVMGVLSVLFLFERTDVLAVDLQGGETKRFAMDAEHATRVVREFSSSSPDSEPTPEAGAGPTEQSPDTGSGGAGTGSTGLEADGTSEPASSPDEAASASTKMERREPDPDVAREYPIETKRRAGGEEVPTCGGCGAEVDADASWCPSCRCKLTGDS